MIRRPPRSTLSSSSAASDVYKRQAQNDLTFKLNLKDVEKQSSFGEGETATDGYQMLNSRLTKTYEISGKGVLKISLFGNNLLDEAARNHSSFVKDEVPLPGKNYGMKFNLTF